ncbi:MAG: molybdenum cofactor biosynthesis protein [Bacteroidetes bacterium QS_8_68_15]|nr:MAG: molybdenum cofactor biosynthesis protein [Bacteroidetes bacterium QS_8_68_15]
MSKGERLSLSTVCTFPFCPLHAVPSTEDAQRAESFRRRPVRCAVVTIGEGLTEETDRSGSLARKRLRKVGHEVALYKIVPHDPAVIERGITELAGKVDVALFLGGTDRGARAHDAVAAALENELPGFGELYRRHVYERTGPRAMLSRATAGTTGDTLFFSIPGALAEMKRVLDDLILPDLKVLVWETVRRKQTARKVS